MYVHTDTKHNFNLLISNKCKFCKWNMVLAARVSIYIFIEITIQYLITVDVVRFVILIVKKLYPVCMC